MQTTLMRISMLEQRKREYEKMSLAMKGITVFVLVMIFICSLVHEIWGLYIAIPFTTIFFMVDVYYVKKEIYCEKQLSELWDQEKLSEKKIETAHFPIIFYIVVLAAIVIRLIMM